jgi:hypothetical protein
MGTNFFENRLRSNLDGNKNYCPQKRKSNKVVNARFSDLLGSLSEEEAEAIKKIIADNFESIHPDDWK